MKNRRLGFKGAARYMNVTIDDVHKAIAARQLYTRVNWLGRPYVTVMDLENFINRSWKYTNDTLKPIPKGHRVFYRIDDGELLAILPPGVLAPDPRAVRLERIIDLCLLMVLPAAVYKQASGDAVQGFREEKHRNGYRSARRWVLNYAGRTVLSHMDWRTVVRTIDALTEFAKHLMK